MRAYNSHVEVFARTNHHASFFTFFTLGKSGVNALDLFCLKLVFTSVMSKERDFSLKF
ncbi:unnamed protein product [Prunus brigantina]